MPSRMANEKDFDTWIRSKWMAQPFYVKAHKFEKTPDGSIKIDRAKFGIEEAEEIAKMIFSGNPISNLSAQIAIWERNGKLIKTVLVVAIILLIIVILFIRR
ncbi:MAG: hypothetical protein ACYC7D_02375 [Nitrososphaerales archaeon]